MDYLAHILWSFLLFYRSGKAKLAMLFGVLPDTASWVPYFVFVLLTGPALGKPDVSQIPAWVFFLYGLSHSVFTAAVVFGIVYVVLRKIPVFMWAWPLHIAIDVPTHTREFLPTPFLWPLSDYAFPGMSWGTPWFMVLNYVSIIGCFLFLFLKLRKIKNKDGTFVSKRS